MVRRNNSTHFPYLKLSRFLKVSSFGLLFIVFIGLIPAWVSADQNNPQLKYLFEDLQQAQTNSETLKIQDNIWRIWLEAPDQSSNDLMTQVSQAMSLGQHELALRLSNQLVDTAPEFAEGWNKRATLQYLKGSHDLSVADIKKTLLLEPRHFGALSGLGLIFMASGRYEAALDAFNSVLQISPASDNARGSVARARSMIGEEI